MTIIAFDLDGTLADNTHRRHYVMGKKKDWDTYNSLMHLDKPNNQIVKLARCLLDESIRHKIKIIILTARFESFREDTEDWLFMNGLEFSDTFICYLKGMYMRKDGDYRPDHIIKLELLEQAKKDLKDDDVAFIVDSQDEAVKMWRDNGYTCLQCNYGDF